MHRTTLELDARKLAKVRRLLGTKGIKATVERAFDEVLALEARKRALEQLRTMNGLELGNARVMSKAWR